MKIKNLFFDSTKKKVNLDKRVIIFFFCLLLSTFFWFLSALSKDYNTNLSIPLKYTKMSTDFLLVEEPPKNLIIRVNGNGFELLGEQMSLNQNAVEVNLNFARPMNDGLYAISTQRLHDDVLEALDKDLNLLQFVTDSLLLKTQEKVSKVVPVKANMELTYKAGYNLRGKAILSPSEVKVSGPKNLIDTLKFVESELVKKENISDSTSFTAEYNKKDLGGKVEIDPPQLEITIPVEKFTEKVFELEVKLNSTRNEEKIRTFPNKVKAVFIVPLSQYESFNENLLAAEVKYTPDHAEQRKLKVYLSGIPNYAELLRIDPESVEFIIKK